MRHVFTHQNEGHNNEACFHTPKSERTVRHVFTHPNQRQQHQVLQLYVVNTPDHKYMVLPATTVGITHHEDR